MRDFKGCLQTQNDRRQLETETFPHFFQEDFRERVAKEQQWKLWSLELTFSVFKVRTIIPFLLSWCRITEKKRTQLPPTHVSGLQKSKTKREDYADLHSVRVQEHNCVFHQHKQSPWHKEELVSFWLPSLFAAALPPVTQGHQTNTTLTFPRDSVLTVGNYKITPKALNQMSAVVLWWDRINIRWCMVRCRACWPQQHLQMGHKFWSTLSHQQLDWWPPSASGASTLGKTSISCYSKDNLNTLKRCPGLQRDPSEEPSESFICFRTWKLTADPAGVENVVICFVWKQQTANLAQLCLESNIQISPNLNRV